MHPIQLQCYHAHFRDTDESIYIIVLLPLLRQRFPSGFLNFCKMVLTMNCEGDHLHPEGLSCHCCREFSRVTVQILDKFQSQFLASKAAKILAGLGFPAYLFLGIMDL